MALTSEEKIRKSILEIFRNIDFLKEVYAKSKREGREYLVILGNKIKKYYRGEPNEVSTDYVQEFRPEEVYAILHTHPRGPCLPSFQDLLAADYVLFKYSTLSIHGVICDTKLILYNHHTINTDALNHAFALAPVLTDEDKIKMSGAITVNINPLDLSTIPDVVDHFVGWMIYWRVLGHDTYFFNFDSLNMYNVLKRYSLFISRGRQLVDWNGKKEANIYWFVPEINKRGTARIFKVYEFVVEDKIYKAIIQDYGDDTEIDGIKAIDLIEQCKTKKLCRVI